ncbi:MAG: DUF1501 domain-containing protein [Pirellulaceae bacterium]|nr:DUF1501 domain-containing protein [Pirellulaceae bacterium]
MFQVVSNRRFRDCDGATRREFLKVGALGLGGLTLPALLEARANAAQAGSLVKDTAVVWLWLAGGPTHVETFDPKMTAPSEYRSTTGEVATKIPGVTLGGTLPKIASVADKMAFVRSFAHTNSGHGGGTHYVNTGYDNRMVDNGGVPSRPGHGSILARVRGASHPVTGMPTYVRMGEIRQGGGAAFLGHAYNPFDQDGQARKSMELSLPEERLADRRNLLEGLDAQKRVLDNAGVKKFEQQAFNLVLGSSAQAFDYRQESSQTIKRYGEGLGAQLLTARRLCEAGCGFVTISYGGWDMHGNIERSMTQRSPQLDQAVSAFVEDIHERGLDQRILLVISGEFGRTPRVNKNAGRDHWAPLSTLALAGGGLKMGQVIGESAPKVDVPASQPIGPQDLMATIFHVLGIDPKVQFQSTAGRPIFMLEKGRAISELV